MDLKTRNEKRAGAERKEEGNDLRGTPLWDAKRTRRTKGTGGTKESGGNSPGPRAENGR